VQVLENLEQKTTAAGPVYCCKHCKTTLGSTREDYKTFAAHYDEDINYGEPSLRHIAKSAFVLRHFVCPACGVLFEVDMVLATDKPFRSVQLGGAAHASESSAR
jgi:acetone carboxylase gamma subunit